MPVNGKLGAPSQFRLGLVINPIAGQGGSAALKGSDHLRLSPTPSTKPLYAEQRALEVLKALAGLQSEIALFCAPGVMGERVAEQAGFSCEIVGHLASVVSTGKDTEAIARQLEHLGVDLLVFVGGDGTARNVCNAVSEQQPTLGVPAGVKMHSGVFAINPQSAAQVITLLVGRELVNVSHREVRDIDEAAFRDGVVRARYYGELLVPEVGHFVQAVKAGGREVEALVLSDIAAEVIEEMVDDALYIVGPGTTTRAVMEALGLPATLLGVDLVVNHSLLAADVDAEQIALALAAYADFYIVVTPIGGQGVLFGRGNQQITPSILRRVGRDHLRVIATKTKITALAGRPLLLDTGDPALDRAYCGYITVITGYRDRILYALSNGMACAIPAEPDQ